jgi:hypothetical protein
MHPTLDLVQKMILVVQSCHSEVIGLRRKEQTFEHHLVRLQQVAVAAKKPWFVLGWCLVEILQRQKLVVVVVKLVAVADWQFYLAWLAVVVELVIDN